MFQHSHSQSVARNVNCYQLHPPNRAGMRRSNVTPNDTECGRLPIIDSIPLCVLGGAEKKNCSGNGSRGKLLTIPAVPVGHLRWRHLTARRRATVLQNFARTFRSTQTGAVAQRAQRTHFGRHALNLHNAHLSHSRHRAVAFWGLIRGIAFYIISQATNLEMGEPAEPARSKNRSVSNSTSTNTQGW